MKPRLRLACIGGQKHCQSSLKSWTRLDDVVPYAVCTGDIETARATGVSAYDDPKLMLREIRPDVLDVALPAKDQFDAIALALDNAVNAILCAPPLCTTHAQAQELVERAEAMESDLVVMEPARFMPWVRAVRAALDQKRIGKPLHATIHLPSQPAGTPVSQPILPYLEISRVLFFDPVAVTAKARTTDGTPDQLEILLEYPGQTRCVLHLGSPPPQTQSDSLRPQGMLEIEGTIGTITYDGGGSLIARDLNNILEYIDFSRNDVEVNDATALHDLQCHVTSGLLSGTPLENTARDYLVVKQIEEAIDASVKTGRKIRLGHDDTEQRPL